MGQRQNGDPSTDRFYFTNDRGDVRFLAHWDGTATDDGVLTNAWGEKVGNGGTGWTPTAYVYRGALGYESEPGDNTKAGLTLDYLQQRYYDPTIGRFISPDPIGLAGGLNLYEYAGDDPLTYSDPSGMLTGRQWRKLGRTAARIAIISLVTSAGASAGLAEGGVGAVPGAVQGAIYGSLLASELLGDTPAEAIEQAAMNGAFTYVGGSLCRYGVNAYQGWKAGQAAGAFQQAAGAAGFSTAETAVMQEARAMLASPEVEAARGAFAEQAAWSGEIGGRPVQFEPHAFSGFTNFEGGGFSIGNDAFSAEGELHKTFLQELYRLQTSQVGTHGSEFVTEETAAAAGFADRAYDFMTIGGLW